MYFRTFDIQTLICDGGNYRKSGSVNTKSIGVLSTFDDPQRNAKSKPGRKMKIVLALVREWRYYKFDF